MKTTIVLITLIMNSFFAATLYAQRTTPWVINDVPPNEVNNRFYNDIVSVNRPALSIVGFDNSNDHSKGYGLKQILNQANVFRQNGTHPPTHSDPNGQFQPKREYVAVSLSLGFTLVPILLVTQADASPWLLVAGAIAGPSVGLFYTGYGHWATRGILIRVGGSLVTLIGVSQALHGFFDRDSRKTESGSAIAFVGLGIVGISAAFDTFYRAPRAVREFNSKHDIGLSPWVHPESGAPGLSLTMRF